MGYGPIAPGGAKLSYTDASGTHHVGWGYRAQDPSTGDGLGRFFLYRGYPSTAKHSIWTRDATLAAWDDSDWKSRQDDRHNAHSGDHPDDPMAHTGECFAYLKVAEVVSTSRPTTAAALQALLPSTPLMPSGTDCTEIDPNTGRPPVIHQIWPASTAGTLMIWGSGSNPGWANAKGFVFAIDDSTTVFEEYWAFIDPTVRLGTSGSTTMQIDRDDDGESITTLADFVTLVQDRWVTNQSIVVAAKVGLHSFALPIGSTNVRW